ncbi:hypothetical protein [Moheibacter sediminis]|uniref:Lipoprotein n=1 Tax=Moheibacter sediminis TaxID=1434700 RepID=A0A1W2CF78_9FLAO|nr:hypothetical protein [Moheibacter sediminis]SMC83895.1 hypothetical protein SAMN06296427_11017 [Moheibacter sediminis]
MKYVAVLALLIFMSSCASLWNSKNYEKCKDKCYQQYQLAVKPCQNSLYGEECKELPEQIYKDCMEQCKIKYNNAERGRKEQNSENLREYFGD